MPMKSRYTVVDGEVIAQKRNGVRTELIPDMLGSTVAVVNMAQEMTDSLSYHAYGELSERSGGTVTPFQFVGTRGYYQDAPGRSYVRARYLDSGAGRWITQDPIGLWVGVNLYQYCNSNPTNFLDPSGLRPLTDTERQLLGLLYQPDLNVIDAPLAKINIAVQNIKDYIDKLPSNANPPGLKAIFWALSQLSPDVRDNWGGNGSVSIPGFEPILDGDVKCNMFVAAAYTVGAKVSYPTNKSLRGHCYPPAANDLAQENMHYPNLPLKVGFPQIGDLFAFHASGDQGHATLWLGPGLLIYAGPTNAKVGTFTSVMDGHDSFVMRRWAP